MTSQIFSYIQELKTKLQTNYDKYQRARASREKAELNEADAHEELLDTKFGLREAVYIVMDLKKDGADIQGTVYLFFFFLLRKYLAVKEEIVKLVRFLDAKENEKLLGINMNMNYFFHYFFVLADIAKL